MGHSTISSKQNEQIKLIKRLEQKKHRDREGLFYLEGVRLVEEAMAGGLVQSLFYSQRLLTTPRGKQLLHLAKDINLPVWACTEAVFAEIADTVNSQGVVAVAAKPTWPSATKGLFVVADAIQDPGNMGTLLRTGAAAGIQGLLVIEGSVDLYNPKVVRASMGAIFHLPHWFMDRQTALEFCRQHDIYLVAADITDAEAHWSAVYPDNTALVIGNEARGVHQDFLAEATLRVRIPLAGSVESLNASVAAGILLYEILRQKETRGAHGK